MKSIPIIFIFFALLESAISSWSDPVTVFESQYLDGCRITSYYYDPSSKISHVFFVEGLPGKNYYYALDENGNKLYSTVFTDSYGAWSGIIKGSDDGKSLFIAMQGYRKVGIRMLSDVNFTESKDGGKTWSPVITTPHKSGSDETNRLLGDMIVQKQTGRIFIFYGLYESKELGMVTRTPGSTIFSQEVIIEKQIIPEDITAAYTTSGSTTTLHLFYGVSNALRYTQSTNNGNTWEYPENVLTYLYPHHYQAFVNQAYSDNVYVGVFEGTPSKAALMISKDSGETFKKSVYVTEQESNTDWNQMGFAVCGSKSVPFVASMVVTYKNNQRNPEYSWVDAAGTTIKGRTH